MLRKNQTFIVPNTNRLGKIDLIKTCKAYHCHLGKYDSIPASKAVYGHYVDGGGGNFIHNIYAV